MFLLDAGAEIIFETARFWARRAELGDDGDRHIRGVIGPDEYHQARRRRLHQRDGAWNIRRAYEVAELLQERWPRGGRALVQVLLGEAELEQWRLVAASMATGFDPKTGLFEQFHGYFGLEQIDLADYAGRSVPMDVVLGRERIGRSQVVKQADVVALLALQPEAFPADSGRTNFRYYEPRCGQGSSLSRAMHGLAAARLGDTELALRFFRETAAIDLADTHVAIAGGIHIAALGGLWQIAVFGFAGLSLRSDGVAIEPRLPAGWRGLRFSVQWRSRRLRVEINQATCGAHRDAIAGPPMTLFVGGERPRSLQGASAAARHAPFVGPHRGLASQVLAPARNRKRSLAQVLRKRGGAEVEPPGRAGVREFRFNMNIRQMKLDAICVDFPETLVEAFSSPRELLFPR